MGSESNDEKEKVISRKHLTFANYKWKDVASSPLSYFASTTAAGEAFAWPDPDLGDLTARTYASGSAPLFQPQQAGTATVERKVERVTTTTTTRVSVPPHTHTEIIDFIDSRIGELRDEIMERLDSLENLPIKVVNGRDVSEEEAVALVEGYYEEHESGYPSDIAEALGLSLESVVRATEHLKAKGILRPKNKK